MTIILDELDFLRILKYYSMKHWKGKNLSWIATKLIQKIPDATNAKRCYQTSSKNKKSVKQSKAIAHQPKTLKTHTLLT